MLSALILFAQEDGKSGGGGGISDFIGNPITPFLLMMVVFFFLIILPAQRREKKQREAIMSSLKKNDEVVTSAGIIGIVAHIKDNADEVTLKIDDNARLRVLRSSIVRIVKKDEFNKDSTASSSANTNIKPS